MQEKYVLSKAACSGSQTGGQALVQKSRVHVLVQHSNLEFTCSRVLFINLFNSPGHRSMFSSLGFLCLLHRSMFSSLGFMCLFSSPGSMTCSTVFSNSKDSGAPVYILGQQSGIMYLFSSQGERVHIVHVQQSRVHRLYLFFSPGVMRITCTCWRRLIS
jgi:hypothetical protein